ncbi:acetyltransferase [Beutenbergia cavernae DSM 12333]|uniref:Acetyltransferase n=1 Tax=Beutenbergia cavernae (strain ATCC BAA-8 / DSM 12333 / CCUG 43141 / JCM 11478 / NBRC 16432 / NCIMB 13614 / HKI 0122) TaxID=471853 RepID=C5C292_BEUC1|nr:GNAT family N-acetyltransferase [Beutenbergia cavernae]ACQ81717.1 acetyltransferase [Beutenbergia cavernae DSM 12333]
MTDSEGAAGADGGGAVVVHVPQHQRFEIRLGSETVGFTAYVPDGDRLVFVHTEIDERHEGQGLAGELVREALDDVRAAGRRIVAVCPYVARYVRRHHDWDDLLDPPTSTRA